MSSIVILYAKALLSSYVTYMTGIGPIALDQAAQWSSEKYRHWASEHGTFRRWAVVVVLLSGILWAGFGAFQQQYDLAQTANSARSTANSERDAAITLSGERQKEIDRLSIQIAGLQTQLSQFRNSQPSPTVKPERNPNQLYQYGEAVADVEGATVKQGNGIVIFQVIKTNGKADQGKNVEYQDWILHCPVLPAPPPNASVGLYIGMVAGPTVCNIIGKQP